VEALCFSIDQSNLTVLHHTTFGQDDHYFRDSKVQRYIRSQVPWRPGSPDFEGGMRRQDSLPSIQDSEIQGYIRSMISRHSDVPAIVSSEAPLRSIAPTIVDKRKRSTATSPSSARRTKCTVAESSPGHLQNEEPSFAQGSQNDPSHAGYGEQKNHLGWDAFAPDANAQGSLNNGQDTENAGHGRVVMPGISAGKSLANHGERVLTDSFVTACLLEEIRRKG
jgi:hypothetical protein